MKMNRFLVVFALIGFTAVLSTASAADIGFKGIGARVGFVMPEDPIDNTFGLGLQVKLGTFIPELGFEALVDYWSKSYDTGVSNYDASITDIGVGVLVKYYFMAEGGVKPYAGAGPALQFGRSKVDTPLGEVSDTDTDFALHLLGGVELPLSEQIDGLAEVKYVASDLNYFGIFAGIVYNLGK
jgi:opacity protein-like surface antigen